MNEQLRKRAQEIADENNNDAYSVALYLAVREKEIRGLKKQLHDEIASVKKIKAEAVREATRYATVQKKPNSKVRITSGLRLMQYAEMLENQND